MKEIIHKMFVASLTEKFWRTGSSIWAEEASVTMEAVLQDPTSLYKSGLTAWQGHMRTVEKEQRNGNRKQAHKRRNREKDPRLSSTFSTGIS